MLNPLYFGIESSVENLLPELLLALLGHTGGAFTAQNSSSESITNKKVPKLSDAVDWVTESEREQINRLVSLGYYFSCLEKFVDESGEHAGTTHIYRNALANGVTELLDVYRSAVLEVEHRLLRRPAPPLLSIQHFLGDFETLFPEVLNIVHHACNNSSIPGSVTIMTLLKKKSRCGIPVVQACMLRLLWHCTQVLFKQLESWILYGKLIDPGKEFFIQDSYNIATGVINNTAAKMNKSSTTTTETTNDNPHRASIPSMSSLDGIVVMNDALPPGVPSTVASKILFIGKAAKILRLTSSTAIVSRTESLHISEMLWNIGRKEEGFRTAEIEHVIESIRKKVAAVLWSLMTEHCNIDAQLALMQDICLMGRADVYHRLVEGGGSTLFASIPAPHSADDDVHAAFVEAMGHTGYEKKVEQFALRWSSDVQWSDGSRNLYIPRYNDWDGLWLECSFDWPIGLLFPPEVLQKYSAMWQYLHRIKCVKSDVDTAWSKLMVLNRKERRRHNGHANTSATTAPGIMTPAMDTHATMLSSNHHGSISTVIQNVPSPDTSYRLEQLRGRISHFINSLALSLQIDVIGASACVLRNSMRAANDFTTADAAHRQFVDELILGACLDIRQLMMAVESIFKIAREFCTLVENIEKKEASLAIVATTVTELDAAFVLKQNLVLQLMQSNVIQSGPRGGPVRQFMVRLNFNDFCTKEALEQIQTLKEGDGVSAITVSEDGVE